MSAVRDLIGDVVVDKSGNALDSSSLFDADVSNPVLGLYFSAHWCPPCRDFTPVLTDFYHRFRSTPEGQRFEIVFVSSDFDEEAYQQYMHEMPWPAIPYADKERVQTLSKQFHVKGIPLFVLVDAVTGQLITNSGRKYVVSDPEGIEFPWLPEPLSDILSRGKLLKGSEEIDCKKALAGKVKGLYFSAQWCPPCRVFTPDLLKSYEILTGAGRNFEVVYVSWDRSHESFNEYFVTMPWLAFPFQDPRIMKLAKNFNVKGIPALVLVDENNELITTDGRTVISNDKDCQHFPWVTPAIEELSENNAPSLNDSTSVVLFTGGDMDLLAKVLPPLTDVAQVYIQEQKKSLDSASPLPHLNFFYEGPSSADVAEQLKSFVFNNGNKPTPDICYAVLDIPEQRVYSRDCAAGANVVENSDSFRRLIDDFKNDKIPFVPFRHSEFDA